MSFLGAAAPSAGARRLFDADVADRGYVMNASRIWAHRPAAFEALFGLLREIASTAGLGMRERGILVAACASTLGDSYCALAWGERLATAAGPATAAAVLRGGDEGLTPGERAMAGWARKVTSDPNGTSATDVQALRDAGYGDDKIFAITTFVALRLAFSTVNDALGARPDAAFRSTAPRALLDAVDFGRPIDD
jgi:uncharacterized peroxidase-related enzyme